VAARHRHRKHGVGRASALAERAYMQKITGSNAEVGGVSTRNRNLALLAVSLVGFRTLQRMHPL